jgi:hypothetical protein
MARSVHFWAHTFLMKAALFVAFFVACRLFELIAVGGAILCRRKHVCHVALCELLYLLLLLLLLLPPLLLLPGAC